MVSMLDCIRRVPERMEWIAERYEELFQPLNERYRQAEKWDEIVMIGCGTSNTSAVTARFPAQKLAGIRVTPTLPGDFLNERAVRNEKALYVFVSQSGTSVLTRQAQKEAQRLGYATVALSAFPDTPIAQETDAYLCMGCGKEEYPMSTIGYSTSVLMLTLLGLWVGLRQGALAPEAKAETLRDVLATAGRIGPAIDQTVAWMEKERRGMMRSDCLVFTGSGALCGVAMEAAIKMWETPQVITLAYELEEGLHGAPYGYTQRHCVIVLNDGGVDDQKARSLASFMKNEKHNGFLIGENPVDEHDLPLTCQGRLDCLVFGAVIQTMAYHLAVAQGRDLYAPHDNRVMYSYFDTHNEVSAAKRPQ